jgi:hypothetical protein
MNQSLDFAELAKSLHNAQKNSDRFAESIIIPNIARLNRRQKGYNQNNYPGHLIAFFEKVAYGLGPCWYWTGAKNYLGYGLFAKTRAHRFSYEFFKGPIPAGLSVLHSCDVRNCVNPEHLSVGTQLENMRDAARKGRIKNSPKLGSENPNAALDEALVLEIRKKYSTGEYSNLDLSYEYGVSFMTISRVLNRQMWRHI